MNSFRLFLIEQEQKPQWFEKIKMPEMAGNALMVTGQYANNFKNQITESHGDVHPGRGFPLNKGATNMLSIVPVSAKASKKGSDAAVGESKNIGPMIYAFDWIVHKGLYEALQIRRKMAQQASQDLGAEITEDAVYSPKAHQAIPGLKEWFEKLDPSEMEPKSMIKFPVGSAYQRISLDDVNQVIGMLNEKQGAVNFDEFRFGGPEGFIEWIEDGPWAEKIGTVNKEEPWRTKHGVSLHDAKVAKDPETGQLAYQFGGIISPMRNLEGSFQKKMRGYVQGLIADTAKTVAGKANTENLTPEEQEFVEQLQGVFGGTNVMQFNFGSFSSSRGYSQSDAPEFDINNAADYAAHVLMLRAAIDMRAAVNDALAGGAEESSIMQQFGINQKELNQIRGKESNRINSSNKEKYYQAFGVDPSKEHWKTGVGKLKRGTADLRASSMLNFGWSYLKHMMKKQPLPIIIKQYLGDEIKSGSLGDVSVKDIAVELKSIADEAGTLEVPKLGLGDDGSKPVDLKTNFGTKVKDTAPLNDDQLKDLISKGYQFQPDRGEPEDITNAKKGKLVKSMRDEETGGLVDKTIVLRRKKAGDTWNALYVDEGEGADIKKYSTDVPLLAPSRGVKYGGSSYMAGKAGSGQDMAKIMADMESNPEQYGYGIGGLPNTVDQHLRTIGGSMISSGKTNSWDSMFVGRTPGEIAQQLKGYMLQQLTGSQIKYGNLDDTKHLETIYKSLSNDVEGLPGLEANEARDWIKKVSDMIKAGQDPAQQGVPQEVHNAFLVAGAWYRAKLARQALRRAEKGDDANQFAMMKGKEGGEQSTDGNIADSGKMNADDRMANAQRGQANTMRNRLGLDKDAGITGGEEIEAGSSESDVKIAPVRSMRNLENDGQYVNAYRKTEALKLSDGKEISRMVRSVKGEDSRAKGTLDALADSAYKVIRSETKRIQSNPSNAALKNELTPLVKDLGLTILSKYKVSNDTIDFKQVLKKALGNYYAAVISGAERAKKLEMDAFRRPAQPVRPAASQPVAEPSVNTLQADPVQPQPQPPKKSGGLGGFMKKPKRESYSFRTRYLRKLAESEAIGTGEKFTGNWWGAMGDPLGVSIDGEVEDRQSNPDGTKNKKGKKKSGKNRK